MNRRLRFFIQAICILGVCFLVTHRINRLGGHKPYIEPPVIGQQVEITELKSFLKIWVQLMQSPLGDKMTYVSLNDKSTYPPKVVKWLELHNWNAERFFYNEQHLQELLNYVNIQEELKQNIELNKKENSEGLRKIIRDQQRKIATCPYDKKELNLISDNRYQITEILAGRAVLKH